LCEKLRRGTQSEEGVEYPNTIRRKTTKWICHILHRNCLLIHVIEGKKEGRVEVREDEAADVRSCG